MNLCELMVKYPFRCFVAACILCSVAVTITEIIMEPAVIYAEGMTEKRGESSSTEEKKSDD